MNKKTRERIQSQIKKTPYHFIQYAKRVLNYDNSTIAKITGYALSTVRKYISEFRDLLESAKQIFDKFYITATTKGKTYVNPNLEIKGKTPCAYVIEIYENEERRFLKIGKTKNICQRPKEICKYAKKHWNFQKPSIKILDLYYTEDEEQALTMENVLRKHYKQDLSNGFIPNDRFEKAVYTKENKDMFEDKHKLILAEF